MSNAALHPPAPPPLPARPGPKAIWGAWATLGWGALIAVAYLGAGLLIMIPVIVLHVARGGGTGPAEIEALVGRGDVLALVSFVPGVVGLALVVGVIRLRGGARLTAYLGLARRPARDYLVVAGLGLLLVAVHDGTSLLLGRPIVPEVMVYAYRNCVSPFILWIALVVGAPVFEETYFRGFLLPGLQRSLLRPWGAVLLTALLWAAVHVQYDLYAIFSIFLGGLLLGAIRVRTGNLWLCIFLHGMMNVVATLETAWFAARM